MNRFEQPRRSGEAQIRYLDGDFQILANGSHVTCAVTGLAIPLDETIDTVTVSLITRIGRQLESAPRRLLTAFESGMARWAATASR